MTDGSDGGFRWSLTPGNDADLKPNAKPDGDAAGPAAGAVSPKTVPDAPSWDMPTAASPVVANTVFPLPESTLAASDIDVIFADSHFVDYAAEAPGGPHAVAPSAGLRPSAGSAVSLYPRPRAVRAPALAGRQAVLLGVAGALLTGLACLALFLLGGRIGESQLPVAASIPISQPISQPSSQPSTSARSATLGGPVAVGEHSWDELRGGECLTPYENPWQDAYTVVDCGRPHQAQLLATGVFSAAISADSAPEPLLYPAGVDLQNQAAEACSAPSVLDFAAAGAFDDIQIAASYPATASQWDAGNRTYYCFASRTGGGELTGSITVPAT